MSYAPIYHENVLKNRSSTLTDDDGAVSRTRSTAKPKRRSRTPGSAQLNGSSRNYPIIVHSHLCWEWVWQRPQQFISRLSRIHPVLFIETLAPDPELAAPLVRFKQLESFPNITLLRLQFPAWCWNDAALIDRERTRLVQEFLAGPGAGKFMNPVQWFYDPMVAPCFLGQADEILNVYDCMDELSKFAFAPPQLLERESLLLERADVVFTGGRRLYHSKRRFNNNCHFHGCGVEGPHFAKARLPGTPLAPEIKVLPKPVFGYFGVVDERIDYDLLGALADANPGGSIAIVGPVLKVDERSLPRRPNLHWLGKRAYEELPALCKGFDVCLMPFALNDATEFINPTKALEYMATGKPIVSTAVPDVISNFSSVVAVASSRGEFLNLCAEAAEQPEAAAIERGLQMAAANSWDAIVAQLEAHIQEALVSKAKGAH